jgi:hypothetical protein
MFGLPFNQASDARLWDTTLPVGKQHTRPSLSRKSASEGPSAVRLAIEVEQSAGIVAHHLARGSPV